MTRRLCVVCALLLGAVAYCRAWDFRDEVYTCTTAGMSLAELQSAGVTLVSHVPHTREWMQEARSYGIRGMPYISLYKVYDPSAPGAAPVHPFWSAVDMTDHPEWVYIGADGERKRPFNNPYYPEAFWQSCTNTAGIADAYVRGAVAVMEQGAGGVFIDNVLPAEVCHGPEFGVHEHLYPDKDNIHSFKIALGRVQEAVRGFGPDSVVMLNVGQPWDRWTDFGDCIMLESFIFNVSVRPGPGGWVGKERVQVKQWPQILEWIQSTADFVDGGGSIVALEYLPEDPETAHFSYACDKLANFLWTGSCGVRRDVLRTLYRCRLQRASGPLEEMDGVYYRHYSTGMAAVNPTEEKVSVRVPAPPGFGSLADCANDEVQTVRRGKVRIRIDPGVGQVYVSPQSLAEGHLREALVAVATALEQAAPDESAKPAPELSAAAEAIRSARAAVQGDPGLAEAAQAIGSVLHRLSESLAAPPGPDLSQRLTSGEKLSREQVRTALSAGEDAAPRVEVGEDGVFVTGGGVRWRVGGQSLLHAGGMGANLGLTIHPLHEAHGWLHPTNILRAELTADEPNRKAVRVTMDFAGQKSGQVIPGAQLELLIEARAGDPMLAVTSVVRNVGEEPIPAYFTWSTSGAGVWCSRPGEPAASADDYVNFPGSDWTCVSRSQHGGRGLMIFTDLPQSYSPYAINLYSEPRSGELAPGEARSLDFEIGLVRGAWQHDPRAVGPIRRAQVYASRAYSIATGGKGLPKPSLLGDAVAGLPIGVRLCAICVALTGHELELSSVDLLDANGTTTVPAEVEVGGDVAVIRTEPSLRDDLYYQVVGEYQSVERDVPIALVADLRLDPSLSMEVVEGAAVWSGLRGEATCLITNHLAEDAECTISVEAPEGYATPEPTPVKLAAGATTELPLAVTSEQQAAPPAGVRAVLRLASRPGAGELAAQVHFRPTAACPRIQAPSLDGKLGDPGWQRAARASPFGLIADGTAPREATTALVGRDEEYLYVAFDCMESRVLEMHAEAKPQPGVSDPAVHKDDSVEVFLDPPGEAPYVQLAANCLGAQKTRGDVSWEVATDRGKDRWTVEMRVLLNSLGASTERGARWGANFCRTQIRLKENSAWSPTGRSFHEPDRFGVLIFE